MNHKTKVLKTIPNFRSEVEEIEFWETHDTTDYIDWSKAIKNPSFPNLKMSTKTITLRVTESLSILDEGLFRRKG